MARQPLLILLVALAAGSAGVVYSAGPLHGAKNWRIDYLDTQLSIQNLRVRDLESTLRERSRDAENDLGPTDAAALRQELASAVVDRDRQAARADAAEAQTRKARNAGDRWLRKFRDAEASLNGVRQENSDLALQRDGLLARLSAVGSHSAPPPAAADPNSTVFADGLELMVGESWSSPDGQVSFEVVDVDKEVASLRGSWQSRADGPEQVSAGHQLTERRGGAVYLISITTVTPYRSITIRAASSPP
jgi:hypothetical protein